MILDTSAVVAVLQLEPEAERFANLMASAAGIEISAATVLEASIVLGPTRQNALDKLLGLVGASVASVDEDQLAAARLAYLTYGRRSGSPARLDYADCFSYALAKCRKRPLLFKGNDFGHTDIEPADS
ncbi:type II toxin-antitoxin system VapC family toxin [Microlunatus sp. GCM10028923]|uniref:type II toxin-antitoxin system VapC family toxin n=1 Tax=Microlunatus sp. GCM10028923 TaxID=3273400 RepID=UPI00360C0704